MNDSSILGLLNQEQPTPNLEPIKKMWQMVKMSQNPEATLRQMIQNNPRIAEVVSLYNKAVSSGQNPEQLFYALAKQRGVDPETCRSYVSE